jgi:O-antigen/teichoic acid export membrane protein
MRLLRRNLVSTYAAWGVGIGSGLVVTPILVHALGEEEYGLWAFIGAVTVFLGLLDFGVGPSVVRFAALARGRGDPDERSAIASAALVLYAALAAAAVVAGLALAWAVPAMIGVGEELVWPARIATLLVVAGFVLRFPLGIASNLLVANQRFDVVNLGNAAALVLYTVLVVALLADGTGGVVLVAGLSLAAAATRLLLPLFWLPREAPHLRLRRRLVTRRRLGELAAFSWANFLINVAAKVVFSVDVVVVGLVLGAVEAAFYAIPAKLFGIAAGAGTAGTNLLYPALSELEGRNEPAHQRRLVLSGLRVGMALMLVLALPLVLIPDQLIAVWIGEGFEESTWIAVLLGLSLLVHQPPHVLGQFLVARGRPGPLGAALLVVVAANLALSVVLALTVGLWGVALSTLVTESAAAFFVVPRLVAEAGGPPARVLASAWLRPLLPGLAAAVLVLVVVSRTVDPDGIASLVLVGGLWVAVAVPLLWRFGFPAEEREALRRRLAPRLVPAISAPDEVS